MAKFAWGLAWPRALCLRIDFGSQALRFVFNQFSLDVFKYCFYSIGLGLAGVGSLPHPLTPWWVAKHLKIFYFLNVKFIPLFYFFIVLILRKSIRSHWVSTFFHVLKIKTLIPLIFSFSQMSINSYIRFRIENKSTLRSLKNRFPRFPARLWPFP